MRVFLLKRWKIIIVAVVALDMLLVSGLLVMFAGAESSRVAAAELARLTVSPTASPTPAATATLWPGPGKRVTPTSTRYPTPLATDVLAVGGFPPGFTPTPRPTRAAVKISLPYVYPIFRNNVDVPVINQIDYPEPFFPPGTNNACGPVALYAAVQALGVNVDYGRLRDWAVASGFTHYGISKGGMVGTAAAINQELGSPLTIEHGDRYSTQDLIKQIRTGGVAIVLVQVRKSGSRWFLTPDPAIGHFLIVDSINMRRKTVQFAGSTLGMEQVSLQDFIQSWSGRRDAANPGEQTWQSFLKTEPARNWALIIRRR